MMKLGQIKPVKAPHSGGEETTESSARKFALPKFAPPKASAATIGLAAILFGLGGFMAWAGLAPIAGGTIAAGEVAPAGSIRAIETEASGRVADVFVTEGQVVSPGDALLAVDATESAAELGALEARIASRRILSRRILMEIEERGDPAFCEALTGEAVALEVRDFCANQHRILDLNLEAAARERELIDSQIARLEAGQASSRSQLANVADQRALLAEELGAVEQLFEKGLTTRPRVSALRREISALDGRAAAFRAELEIAERSIAEKRSEMEAVASRRARENTARLAELENELFEMSLSRGLLERALERATVRAPVGGRILNLPPDIEGQMVASGESVLSLVPERDRMVVEARLAPNDVDRVVTGQTARVVFPALQSYRLPRISGRVSYVSASTVESPEGGPEYYRLRLELAPDMQERVAGATDGQGVVLPGMAADVIIETEQQTFLAYVTEPIRRSVMFAFRDS